MVSAMCGVELKDRDINGECNVLSRLNDRDINSECNI